MVPRGRPLSDTRVFSTYPSSSPHSLPELSIQLLHQQQETWPHLKGALVAFRDTRVRELQCEGYSVFLQFNPRRIFSTAAKVDATSIKERKCFLCPENLPAEQKGILYREGFLILCNPVPIVEQHLTIAYTEHIPQAMQENLSTFLALAKDASPSFSVLYNGPKCGASAPDHLHFQACPTGSIPIEGDALDPAKRQLRKTNGTTSIYTLTGIGRATIVLEGEDASGMESSFEQLTTAMQHALRTDEEPMMNIVCSHNEGKWRMIVFPRSKHRPDAYFKEGDGRVVISPAVIDVGGLIVTPMDTDFYRVGAETIQSIYDEVLIDGVSMERIFAVL